MIGVGRALIEKDLRELRPWAILCLFLGGFDLVEQFFKQLDMRPVSETIDAIGADSGRGLWLIAFAIGTGLGPREVDEGTLSFLDAVPVSRSRVFATKLAVTIAIISIAPSVSLAVVASLHWLSRESLDSALRPGVLLACYAMQLAMIAHGTIVGAAVGWLRSLTWLFVGAFATGLALLVEGVPRAALLNPLALAKAEVTHVGLKLDPELVAVQLAVAAVALLASFIVFTRVGTGRPARPLSASSRPALRALITAATLVTLFAAVALWLKQSSHDDADDQDGESGQLENQAKFKPSPPAQTVTEHYRISYPALQAQAALALARMADAIFVRTHALLHVPPGASIDVDASGSAPNTAGTAYTGRLRMTLEGDTARVLAHETTHVIAQRIVGAELDWLWEAAPVLNEGLATWVERHFIATDAEREAQLRSARLLLAALHTRRGLRIDDLANLERLAAQQDEDLKYPAGEALIAAVARLYGEDAPPRLVRAFGHDKLPTRLRGLELWQATFQVAGFDLGAVVDDMFRQIALDAEQRAAEIEALPRPRVRLVKVGGSIAVEVMLDGEARPLPLRFKPNADSPSSEYDFALVTPGVAWRRRAEEIQAGQVCVQAGVNIGEQRLYEPWICLPTSGAVRWAGDD